MAFVGTWLVFVTLVLALLGSEKEIVISDWRGLITQID